MSKNCIELTIIIPTYNERENVSLLVSEIENKLQGVQWKVFFVDDSSTDGTIAELERLAKINNRVDGVIRYGARGLSGAVLTGLMYSKTEYIAVMDADLQHDPSVLKEMLFGLRDNNNVDLAVASRYLNSNTIAGLNKARLFGSVFLTKIARFLLTKNLSDPMSGFFVVRWNVFMKMAPHLSKNGYKILLDLVCGLPSKSCILEYELIFRERNFGKSKMDFRVVWELIIIFLYRLSKNRISRGFISFALVGTIGLIVHLILLAIFFKLLAFDFTLAQILSTLCAMLNNFFLNNYLTYQSLSLTGKSLIIGYIKFSIICMFGVIISHSVANFLLQNNLYWLFSGSAGIAAGACWNYLLTKFFTWKSSDLVVTQINR